MPPIHPRPLALLLALAGTPFAAGAQEGVAEIARRARDATADAVARARALDELLDHGPRGAIEAARIIAQIAKREAAKIDKARREILQRFDRSAARQVAEQIAGHDAEIADLRRKVLQNAHRQDLTKAQIEAESDPAVDRLRELLTLWPSDAIDADSDLLRKVIEIEAAFDQVTNLEYTWQRAAEIAGDVAELKRLTAPADGAALRDALHAELELRALLAMPMSSGDATALRKNIEAATEIADPEEVAGIRALNELLIVLGKPVLRTDTKLCDASRDHSADMHRLNFFAHESPVEGKKTPGARAARFGTSGGAENIARGHRTGAGAIRGWWYSPGHHRNMLGSHSRVGLGHVEGYWTQMFGG